MLQKLFDKYQCDKSSKHSYHTVYEREFESIQNDPIHFLEIGVFKGQSLQAWLDYFPNATFYGIDIFTRVDPKDIAVLQNKRVKWVRADSTKTNIRDLIETVWSGVEFDVILDDGLHTPRANGQTFNNMYRFLKPGGKYYIEDVWPLHIMSESEKNHWWVQKYPELYNNSEIDYFMRQVPRTKLTEFDLRKKSGHPDSYIMKIEK
jgi:SAM-dependent methyltransferase